MFFATVCAFGVPPSFGAILPSLEERAEREGRRYRRLPE
jgi:hypothetical protein